MLFVTLMSLIASFSFVSCDKEENIETGNLVGDWILIKSEGYEEDEEGRDDYEEEFPTEDYEVYQSVIKFREKDGELFMEFTSYYYVEDSFDYDNSIKIEVRGSEIVPVIGEKEVGEYGDVYEDLVEEFTFKIKGLSSTTLVLYNASEYVGGSYEDTSTYKKLD